MTQTTLELPRPAAGASAARSGAVLGMGLCMLSATAFGLAALFAKECFAAGFSVSAMLAGRFGLAALVFWVIVAIRRPALPGPRVLLTCLALGGLGYAVQAACYFSALTRIDASLTAQILYVYPAVVLVLGVALRRERASRRKLAALGCSVSGLALLLGSAGSHGPVAPAGVLLAFCSAVTYALYILVANDLPADIDVYLLSALVCSSAAVSVTLFGAGSGSLRVPAAPSGWLWLLPLALVSSVVSIGCFLAGLRLVGPSTAAILSCLEPLVTAASAIVVFGERLTAWQAVGAAVVLAAVVLLRPARVRRPEVVAPAELA
ncbi:DMT family transporter [Jatrophihabitans sp.]|uniref:DMT family transporter n=1 Tax=Jatrophihabitans sp. TaxID=1932789 RepID=UPI002C4C4981|nr:DMT family transporter [Jatrophihabitans sp.]